MLHIHGAESTVPDRVVERNPGALDPPVFGDAGLELVGDGQVVERIRTRGGDRQAEALNSVGYGPKGDLRKRSREAGS